MSEKELRRVPIFEQLKEGQITQLEAGIRLGLSTRQIKRLWADYRKRGALALVSGHRGKPSNHQLPAELKEKALSLIEAHYADFGPTLAQEYLLERHDVKLGVETIRQLMSKHGLWNAKQKKRKHVHQQRQRRSLFGELIQLDGSYHDWFEGRANACCLLVLIDDATSALVGLHFCERESTFGYFDVLADYFNTYGLPMAFYSDKHSIFRVNMKDAKTGDGHTVLSEAMKTLGVELIHAHSPQAKGRVERANGTLQDRLVKALRLEGINSIEEGNAYLPGFMKSYNEKFAKLPKSGANAHCPLGLDNDALDHILSKHSERLVSTNLECSFNSVTYQLQVPARKYRLQNKTIVFSENRAGKITITYNNESLPYTILQQSNQPREIHDDKTLNAAIDKLPRVRQAYKPAEDHPWRQYAAQDKKQTPAQGNEAA